jgi:hypothetical protein
MRHKLIYFFTLSIRFIKMNKEGRKSAILSTVKIKGEPSWKTKKIMKSTLP